MRNKIVIFRAKVCGIGCNEQMVKHIFKSISYVQIDDDDKQSMCHVQIERDDGSIIDELTFSLIVTDPRFNYNSILSLIGIDFVQCCNGRLPHEQLAFNIISSNQSMIVDCIPDHTVKLNAFAIGNMLNAGMFINHFEKNSQFNSDKFKKFHESERAMFANFEHDRKLVTVHFPNIKRNQRCHYVLIRIPYKSIRRIVVDQHKRIYLTIGYPAEIRHSDCFQKGGSFQRSNKSIRQLNWEENGYADDNLTQLFADCPIFTMQFNDHQDLSLILSRLQSRAHIEIEFSSIVEQKFSADHRVPTPHRDEFCLKLMTDCKCYDMEYLIDALFSLGTIVQDQLLRTTNHRNMFIYYVCWRLKENKQATLESLERLLNMIDRRHCLNLLHAFHRIYNKLSVSTGRLENLPAASMGDGYIRLRKVLVTPSRLILLAPETLMGNRVIRKWDTNGERTLRVQFIDDNRSKLYQNQANGLIDKTIRRAMTDGLEIAGQKFYFLGCSNSQMREHGCYFYLQDAQYPSINHIRASLGDFDCMDIPKLIARMGQCFTQTRQSTVLIASYNYKIDPDICGGSDSNGQPYEFSDGVGAISRYAAEKFAKSLHLGQFVPSCFQFRFQGFKGVLSIDHAIDQRIEWAKQNEINENSLHILFRQSQLKFTAPESKHIEIVKYSKPAMVSLNRPLIAILDQTTAKQNKMTHERLTNRINKLCDQQLCNIVDMMINESTTARALIDETPYRFNFKTMQTAGFHLTVEPFVRRLVFAIIRYKIKSQIIRNKFPIPFNLGRTMFGVIDVTGQLQYGQVFVQYTTNIEDNPGPSTEKTILIGNVMVTKSPNLLSGDVRILHAVDIIELHDLACDVIVFPRYGPRPHTNEIAGSDLDGDEYSVIWDRELMFDTNEKAMDFSRKKKTDSKPIDASKLDEAITNFYIDFVSQETTVGKIAYSHLANADLYGIDSNVSRQLASNHSLAVDYSKSGIEPNQLTSKWTDDEPPERAELWPDFMNQNNNVQYKSNRLLGQLFCKIKVIENIFDEADVRCRAAVDIDSDLDIDGWKEYEQQAKSNYNKYNGCISALMKSYGIDDEGELMSNRITTMRSRISDRETEDISGYNTEYVVERKLADIWSKFRNEFFAEFGGIDQCTIITNSNNDDDDRRRVCTNPTIEMKQKAVAYYRVAYESYTGSTDGLLGFGWIAWDVLCKIKSRKQQKLQISLHPIADRITKTIDNYCSNNYAEYKRRIKKLCDNLEINDYYRRYNDFGQLLFVVSKWFDQRQLTNTFSSTDLCLLMIKFGIGSFGDKHSDRFLSIDQLDQGINLNNRIGGIGKCLIDFLQYLTSQHFVHIHPYFDSNSVDALHRMAIQTYYRLAMTGEFDLLSTDCNNNAIIEMDPFLIELPKHINFNKNEFEQQIRSLTGVSQVYLRCLPNDRWSGEYNPRYIVSACGSHESLHQLRILLIPSPKLCTADQRNNIAQCIAANIMTNTH